MAQQNFYTNPAFCQKSEYYPQCKSPQGNQRARIHPMSPQRQQIRQQPIGGHAPTRVLDTSIHSLHGSEETDHKTSEEEYEEQEFYEEMLVDDSTGIVQQKKFLVVSKDGQNYKKPIHQPVAGCVDQRSRYEYLPLEDRGQRLVAQTVPPRVHRYAVISGDEEDEEVKPSGRYALVPVEDLSNNSRYETIIQDDIQSRRYEYIKEDPYEDGQRYKTAGSQRMVQNPNPQYGRNPVQQKTQQVQRQGNPIATQKLHELLQTPRKTRQPQGPLQTPQKTTPQSVRVTPNKNSSRPTPKAQQKLNYTLATRNNTPLKDKNSRTAIVAPICSSPVQSVYSETTFSNKTDSWMNLHLKKPPVQGTLAVAALMMTLCGGVTTGLGFYMIYVMGRLYFLDFGIISGCTCFVLGIMGFRTRNCYWLPNRNYISGYVVLSIFSLLTCAGLLVLLVLQPKPGTPLADMTSGAVCGISVLSLLLACSGVIASYCCKLPPPDNRVEHCARGFTV